MQSLLTLPPAKGADRAPRVSALVSTLFGIKKDDYYTIIIMDGVVMTMSYNNCIACL